MHQSIKTHEDLYALLNTKPTSNLSEIRRAYRHAALLAHPDKGGNAQAFRTIKLAFEVLSSLAAQDNKTICASYSNRRHRQNRACATKAFRSQVKRHRPAQCTSSRKRPSTCMHFSTPKRHCSGESQCQAASCEHAIKSMRSLLQSMAAQQRLVAVQSLDEVARRALLSDMKNCPQIIPATAHARMVCYNRSKASMRSSVHSNIRVIEGALGTKYKAHLVIKGLRLYSDATDYETAIKHHFMFVQMRDSVVAASGLNVSIWEDPSVLLNIFKRVLNEHASSEERIGLHVFVYMRATPWLDKNTFITSAVMKLEEAVCLYIRLLVAQKASWKDFRSEWIALLQHKRNSQQHAEAIVDQARSHALEQQFKRASHRLKQAIKRNALERKAADIRAARNERKHKALEAKAAAMQAAGEREAKKQRWNIWRFRRQGLKDKDLTMEEILGSAGKSC
jgi:hypothetical protein